MKTHFLFIFTDGLGLGADDPLTNPLAAAHMPNLTRLLGGRRLVWAADLPLHTEGATLLALDANLGTTGLPQSATGQAVLLTGRNIPAELGYHYGPKPNPEVAAILRQDNLFHTLTQHGYKAALLNAYPPRYFQGIESGRRLYSAIPLAVTHAGLPLFTAQDLNDGRALSADFTAHGWRAQLGLDAPLLEPLAAGQRLAELAQQYDFAFFEYWLSDYAGHKQELAPAIELLETFDQMLGGLLSAWQDTAGLIFITADHGNLEDLSTRRHTANPVPGLLIGDPTQRARFSAGLTDLTGVAPRILSFFNLEPGKPL